MKVFWELVTKIMPLFPILVIIPTTYLFLFCKVDSSKLVLVYAATAFIYNIGVMGAVHYLKKDWAFVISACLYMIVCFIYYWTTW